MKKNKIILILGTLYFLTFSVNFHAYSQEPYESGVYTDYFQLTIEYKNDENLSEELFIITFNLIIPCNNNREYFNNDQEKSKAGFVDSPFHHSGFYIFFPFEHTFF